MASAHRIVIALDWDAFYCSVEEHLNPALRGRPVGVRQKTIICTCNYVARARGVAKLSSLGAALQACPDLVVVDGEDLTKYRTASRELARCVTDVVGNVPTQALGLDELWLDVTTVVQRNLDALMHARLEGRGLFWFSTHGEQGFECSTTGTVVGHLAGSVEENDIFDPENVAILLGSHLCTHVRNCVKERMGYTCSGGIADGKILAKLAGATHKPDTQTVLFPCAAQGFIDALDIGKVTGVGAHTRETLLRRTYPHGGADGDDAATVRAVRERGSKALFCEWLGVTSGAALWDLFHGVDITPVKTAGGLPLQLSTEDSFVSAPIRTREAMNTALLRLAKGLVTRVRDELRGVAVPRTVRVSIRLRGAHGRVSKSMPLPTASDVVVDAQELRARCLIPLAAQLVEFTHGVEVVLVNVAVVELVPAGGMGITRFLEHGKETEEQGEEEEDDEEEAEGEVERYWCASCARRLPNFAMDAHTRFHALGG
ncbi:uncharacterized protein V1518DRAFT_420730, partial [Limtongia smithiae]|uniref:uncharacterized protein n=1 Tax=Limtongia smithiae TaxID=1125753 RepID=UPI0034CD1F57